MLTGINQSKEALIKIIEQKVEDKILERTNADLLIKLINNADSVSEAEQILQLGIFSARTGFHFDPKVEKIGDTVKYLKKNKELSFSDESESPSNMLIIGDNYDALRQLLISYRGGIDIIYIDPPYSKDKVGKSALTNYDNAITRDNLLSILYPRLLLAKQLLKEEGVIFCSIDDKNQAYVKEMFDDIFHERNAVACLPRVTKKSGKEHSGDIAGNHDYLLVYARDIKQAHFKGVVQSAGYDEKDEFYDERGGFKLNQTLDYDSLYYNTAMDFPLDIDGEVFLPGGSEELYEARHAGNHTVKDWVWRWSKSKFDFGYKNGFVVVKQGRDRKRIYTKTYQNAAIEKKDGEYYIKYFDREKKLTSLAFIENEFSNDNGKKNLVSVFSKEVFDNPKPVALIKHICKLIDGDNLVVLDFFAGSGTTGQAVLELNREDDGHRTFILCTNNEITDMNPNGIALDVTTKRLKRTMTGECYDGTNDFPWIKNNEPLGGSLDVYDIADVPSFENAKRKSPFDLIDETTYSLSKFQDIEEKIKWVCSNFDHTQKYLED